MAEPTRSERSERKRVGIWIRVSTEDQARGDSPEHHERRARHYAEAKDWQVVEVYHLEAVSGKSVLTHKEARRMLGHVEQRHISGLIFSKLARLARNTRELLDIADVFRAHDADLVSLQEAIDTSSPAGRLFYTMIAAMAQWEREEISERVAASVPIRAKLGKPLGGQAPLGYQWVNKELVPHPEEAPVRRRVHELYLEHRRKKTVARLLNEAGYRTHGGAKFSDTTVDRLLRDPTAKGIRRANYTRSTGDGKRWELKPESEWVYTEVEPIVSEDLWDQCFAILEETSRGRRKVSRKPTKLFAGVTYCHCGQKMYVPSNTPKYVCYKCRNKIPIVDLEDIFQEQLRGFHFSEDEIASYYHQADEVVKEKEELVASLESEIGNLSREMEKVYDLYLKDQLSPEGFGRKHRPMEERLKQLEDQLPLVQGELDFLKIQYLSRDQIIEDARDLYSKWPSLAWEERRQVVETIVENIVIEEGEVAINLCYLPTFQELMAGGQRKPILALPCCHLRLMTGKSRPYPRYPGFSNELHALGDHLRSRRLQLGLQQVDAADKLGVDLKTFVRWERNAQMPAVFHYPAIDAFLGYCLYERAETFGDRIRLHREHRGLSHRDLATLLGVAPGTVSRWESGARIPDKAWRLRLEEWFNRGKWRPGVDGVVSRVRLHGGPRQ